VLQAHTEKLLASPDRLLVQEDSPALTSKVGCAARHTREMHTI